jgi:excisionase family DNA binding protein
MQRLYDYRGAAELLRISPQTLRGWVSKGRVPYLKLGGAVRFTERQLEDLLARSERPGEQGGGHE